MPLLLQDLEACIHYLRVIHTHTLNLPAWENDLHDLSLTPVGHVLSERQVQTLRELRRQQGVVTALLRPARQTGMQA